MIDQSPQPTSSMNMVISYEKSKEDIEHLERVMIHLRSELQLRKAYRDKIFSNLKPGTKLICMNSISLADIDKSNEKKV